ncbi:unnamed protein product [Adineta steineri]|uniref:Kinesin light chain n=1 Tax=Adineta steineri TaxID=433720 RepID=A0A814LDE5_9BILA|nr:unnamed protein product [Adineta steineri]CAF1011173.1 unnamed protein product [Adineta steineri]CAF1063179.1 unnamed protein product [Adineta steineri]
MGQFDKAEDIYQVLLDQTKNDKDKAPIDVYLGMIKVDPGKYQEALTFYEKSLSVFQKTLPSNHPDLATTYNNIALEIQQQSLPSNHPDLGSSYNIIGLVQEDMVDYSEACKFYEREGVG